MTFINKHSNFISNTISLFFAGISWAVLIIASVIVGPVFIENAEFKHFIAICIFGGMFYIFPAAGIYYSVRHTVRRKIFWAMVPKGVIPPVEHNRHSCNIIVHL